MTTDKPNYPEHLSEQQLSVALTDSFGESVQIRQLDIKKQQSCGHYCSDIYHLTLKYVKGSPRQSDQADEVEVAFILVKDLFENVSTISNEYFMYTHVLPGMTATLSDCGIARVSPYVYHARKSERESHYFEDLSMRGFEILPRLLGYGETEAMFLLQRLGQFHAASLIFAEQHPDVVSNLREFYARADPALMALGGEVLRANVEHVSKIIETWPGYETIVEKMRANVGAVFEHKFLALFEPSDARIKLVTHGDVWISNILVLKDGEGALKDAIFLDYQTSFLGSPAFDIHNLLMTSVQLPVLQHSYDALIQHYHAAFSGTLRTAHFDTARIPTLATLRDELRRTDYYNYYLLTFPFAQTMLSEELANGMSIHGISDKARMARNRADIFSNERVLQTFKYMLKQFEARNLLD